MEDIEGYGRTLADIKERIRASQIRALTKVNEELVRLYWDIGRILVQKKILEGYGAGVLKRISDDIRKVNPELRGFSHRNLKLMTQFYKEYPHLIEKGQMVSAHSDPDLLITSIPPSLITRSSWSVNTILLEKVKNIQERSWYMSATIKNGWSVNVLKAMIQSGAYERHGSAITNFEERLPPPQSDLAIQSFKDPYIFDFLTMEEPFKERELENGLIERLKWFLLELGSGFALLGNQYHLDVGGTDFYLDLLFYHTRLRCYVVIELKKGPFKPEYAGKINFYLNVLNDTLKHEDDNPTIGIVLCQDKKRIVAEYSLGAMENPIGISDYELTKVLLEDVGSSLPSVEELEEKLREN